MDFLLWSLLDAYVTCALVGLKDYSIREYELKDMAIFPGVISL